MTRYLAMHDYGMGALYWWINAPSAEDIPRTFAEVIVVDPSDDDDLADIPEVQRDDEDLPAGLSDCRAERKEQADQPGFGALAGRGTVYVREPSSEAEETYYVELDPEGWCTRQVCVAADGSAVRTDENDWFFNPPRDLWNAHLAAPEIAADEFEAAWTRAAPPAE